MHNLGLKQLYEDHRWEAKTTPYWATKESLEGLVTVRRSSPVLLWPNMGRVQRNTEMINTFFMF
jgi:hypothetical protein